MVSSISASPSSTEPTISRNTAISSMVANGSDSQAGDPLPIASVRPVTLMNAAKISAPTITR